MPNTYNPNDPYDARIGNGALPIGISGTADRAYTRKVTNDELTSNQLNNLLKNGSPYVSLARQEGKEYAQQRGLLNSSLAAEASEKAAIESALPIASADAGVFANTASENMGALNQRQLTDINADAQITSSQIAAQASMYGDDRRLQGQRENLAFQGEQNQLDRSFNMARDYYNHRYDLETQDSASRNRTREYAAQTGIDAHAQRNVFTTNLAQAALDNPEIFTPEAVAGFYNVFMPVLDDEIDWFDSYLDNWRS